MRRFSLRALLGVTIVAMGLLGLVFALITGGIYQHLAMENQREALVELLRLKTHDLLLDEEAKSRDLGLALQHDEKFQRAFDARDSHALAGLMDNQFHQYFVTANVLKLEKLQALDLNLQVVGASTEGSSALANSQSVCPKLTAAAAARTGAARMQAITGLCRVKNQPYHAVIVPIGGLRLKGYLEVITDPSLGLMPAEAALGMPLKLILPDGKVAYQSAAWPTPDTMGQTLKAEYMLETRAGEQALTVAIVRNIHPLNERLSRTLYTVLIIGGLVIMTAVFISLGALQQMALRPLNALRERLRSVREDPSWLGEQMPSSATIEISELSQDFNEMSAELNKLHQTLQQMAFTDALTQLPNRARFYECLQENIRGGSGGQKPFALFIMDLDRFKEVNDGFGHDTGDTLLKQIGTRLRSVLRHTDAPVRANRRRAPARREGDLLVRLGGDEFAVILPNVADASAAVVVAQKILKTVEQPFDIDGNSFNIGISIGMALYPGHGEDERTLFRAADAAMYEAKQNKRGYVIRTAMEQDAVAKSPR